MTTTQRLYDGDSFLLIIRSPEVVPSAEPKVGALSGQRRVRDPWRTGIIHVEGTPGTPRKRSSRARGQVVDRWFLKSRHSGVVMLQVTARLILGRRKDGEVKPKALPARATPRQKLFTTVPILRGQRSAGMGVIAL